MVVEYVRALMQKRLVCRSGEDRRQLAQQMVQDDQQFRELFQGLVRSRGLRNVQEVNKETSKLMQTGSNRLKWSFYFTKIQQDVALTSMCRCGII